MSALSFIEAEFQKIKDDSTSVMDKLESLIGLHAKAKELTALEAQITSIMNEPSTVEVKVESVLHAMGKL